MFILQMQRTFESWCLDLDTIAYFQYDCFSHKEIIFPIDAGLLALSAHLFINKYLLKILCASLYYRHMKYSKQQNRQKSLPLGCSLYIWFKTL